MDRLVASLKDRLGPPRETTLTPGTRKSKAMRATWPTRQKFHYPRSPTGRIALHMLTVHTCRLEIGYYEIGSFISS